MDATSIEFAPLLPLGLLAALAVGAALVAGIGIFKRARGSILRLAVLALAILALANPVLVREDRRYLPDVALLITDRSPSQETAPRPEQTDEAIEHVQVQLEANSGIELRRLEIEGREDGGTLIRNELASVMGELDRSRLAGVVIVTDGQIHDAPSDLDRYQVDVPVHALLTGNSDEVDRRLVVDELPAYGMVGDPLEIRFRIEDGGAGEADANAAVPVVIRQNGEVERRLEVRPGQGTSVPFELRRAGQTVIEIEAAAVDGELTDQNNRAVFFVNGVRDRLRVLLVSGQPYPGLRVWRNLLKADPAVDLVHFTILRPPEKQDGTPIRELALIAFPSRELFEVKLTEFDLVIFDRYSRRGLLPLAYLDNVARYVEEGGGLLEIAGPEFAHPLSLYRTPLSRVLPGRPSGVVYEQGFLPDLTEVGHRHPVTSGLTPLPNDAEAGEPSWGRWFRQIDVEVSGSQILMNGAADRPLLVLERVGEGRVAQLLSDQVWLWARGVEEGGPQGLLLRRLVHWLMKEPELEEESLRAEAFRDGLRIQRRSLDEGPAEVLVRSPSDQTERVTLEPGPDGLASADLEAGEQGLYEVSDGMQSAFVAVRPIGTEELADMRATPERLDPLVDASGGSIRWLAEAGLPSIRHVGAGRTTAGRDWIGLRRNDRYTVIGASQTSLMPATLGLLLLLVTLGSAWYREGR